MGFCLFRLIIIEGFRCREGILVGHTALKFTVCRNLDLGPTWVQSGSNKDFYRLFST